MNTENTNTSSETDENQPEEKSFFQIIVHSFFIIPFLIAVFCLLLFAGINLLTRENRTVYDYLEDVKTGGLTKRWQGAFELSKILANPKLLPDEDRFYNELSQTFDDSQHDDKRVRQYLALAMGRTGRVEFTETLMGALKNEETDGVVSIIYALGMLQDLSTASALHKFIDYPEARIRSITTVALGNIANPISIPILKKALGDAEPNVQWGAAISLAKMNNESGKQILIKLLDREYLSKYKEVDADEQTNLMIAAIQASSHLKDDYITNKVTDLSKNDPNMNVRSEAMKTLKL